VWLFVFVERMSKKEKRKRKKEKKKKNTLIIGGFWVQTQILLIGGS
jgi:hypothetical protein